jgi:adenylate cyclase
MAQDTHLLSTVYRPRTFGYLLAALMLTQLQMPWVDRFCWISALVAFPHVLQWMLRHYWRSGGAVRFSMMLDGLLVGLLIAVVDFNLEAGVVLVALLCVSVLVLGGGLLLGLVFAALISGAALGAYWFDGYIGGWQFYWVSFFCLISYFMMIGLLVYRETRRLYVVSHEQSSTRNRLEDFKVLFSPFLAPQLLSRDIDGLPSQRRRRLTVFFSDIEGFTALMDSTDESLVASMLDGYFGVMSEIADRHGGTIDKFLGDGVMVFFGDPSSKGPEGDAYACVRMALEMRDAFFVMSRKWQSIIGGEQLHLRMGIHTGYCLVGEFGCEQRRDYTALGSTVNQASRLESDAARDEILISLDTQRLITGRILCKPKGCRKLKGLSRPVTVFSVEGRRLRQSPREAARLLS